MKNKLINTGLILISTLITLLVLEAVLNHLFIHKTPLKFHFALPEAMEVLAQSSKQKRLPHDYIALLGDSYAQGKGDWLLTADPKQNSPYHTAHLIQRYTGQDVISLGRSGASSIKGMVREPIAKLGFIQRNIAEDFPNPKQILVYFYAGNDLDDNWLQIKNKFIPKYGKEKINDETTWNKYFAKIIKDKKVGPLGHIDSNYGWLVRAVKVNIRNSLKGGAKDKELRNDPQPVNNSINHALINDQDQNLPDQLQAPGMNLSEEQTQLALDAFARSLAYMKNYFHDAQITVVYIPSVIESYQLNSERVSTYNGLIEDESIADKQALFPRQAVQNRSDFVTSAIKTLALAQNVSFIDTRPVILAAGQQQLIHGPVDWLHFNQTGYVALTKAILCSEQFKAGILTTEKTLCLPGQDPA